MAHRREEIGIRKKGVGVDTKGLDIGRLISEDSEPDGYVGGWRFLP